jgi:hypothetical protein
MFNILESIVERLIEEEKAIERRSELGFYRPVAMIVEAMLLFTMSSSSVDQIERISMLTDARPVCANKSSSLLKNFIMP